MNLKDETTYGLTPEALARLLAIGLKSGDARHKPAGGQSPGELLQQVLSSELPLDPEIPHSLPAVLNRPCDEILSAAGQSIGDLILRSETDLAIIRTLKAYFKELVSRYRHEAMRAVYIAIYYAAIASALVFHGQKITGHSYHNLKESYVRLEQTTWIPSELKELFKRACTVCQRRKGEPE